MKEITLIGQKPKTNHLEETYKLIKCSPSSCKIWKSTWPLQFAPHEVPDISIKKAHEEKEQKWFLTFLLNQRKSSLSQSLSSPSNLKRVPWALPPLNIPLPSLRRFPTSSFFTSHIFHPSHSFRYSPSSFFREIWSEWNEISSSFNPKKKKKKQYNFVAAWEICSSFSQVLRKQTHYFTPPLHLFSSNF